ncbi:MAG: hypothetical protein ACRCZI_11500, partial [Cetobacterium sp.]
REEDDVALAEYVQTEVARTPSQSGRASWAKGLATGVTEILYGSKEPSPQAVAFSDKKPAARRTKKNPTVQISDPERLPPPQRKETASLKEAQDQIAELQRQLASFGEEPAGATTGKGKPKRSGKGKGKHLAPPTPQARVTKPPPVQPPKKGVERVSSQSGSDSEDSLAPPAPRVPALKPGKDYWYAVVHGKYSRSGVFTNKEQARVLLGGPRTKYRRAHLEAEAWEFVYFHLGEEPNSYPETLPEEAPPARAGTHAVGTGVPPAVAAAAMPTPTPPGSQPGSPPVLLNNRDRSTTDTEELFGINLDVDTKVLRQHLAPPGMADERAIPLMECMVDAVSLPGKISQSGESD